MKNFKNYLVFASLCLLFYSNLNAQQNQKLGFVNSDFILERMPEFDGLEQRLNLLSETWKDELREMDNEIEQLEEDFEAREILFTDEIRQQRLNEIQAKQNDRNRFLEEKFGPEGEYFQQQKELLEPVQRKIFDAINRVAVRDGYDFIFDRSEDVRFLYARPEWNITEDVMLELGIDLNNLRN